MSAAWVAGAVRGRLMLEHCAGIKSVQEVARQETLAAGASVLAGTKYAAVAGAASLEEAERELAGSLALQLRVLAAWLPSDGAGLLRVLAGWFELANIEDRLAYLAGGRLWPPVQLGVLASVWDAASQFEDPGELRRLLRDSPWGEPAGDERDEIGLALRFGWARRVARQIPEARGWAAGAAAILLASELVLTGRPPAPTIVPTALLGSDWPGADSLAELRRRLPTSASWPLAGIEEPEELWRAEPSWWRQVGDDARTMLTSGWQGRGTVVGVVGLLALDAVRVAAALAVAATGGSAAADQVLDALC